MKNLVKRIIQKFLKPEKDRSAEAKNAGSKNQIKINCYYFINLILFCQQQTAGKVLQSSIQILKEQPIPQAETVGRAVHHQQIGA